jgi:hypothetical protein
MLVVSVGRPLSAPGSVFRNGDYWKPFLNDSSLIITTSTSIHHHIITTFYSDHPAQSLHKQQV